MPIRKPVILMHNPKGGVGKTTLAINLSLALSQLPEMTDKKVALIDFDLSGANLSTVICRLPLDEVRHKNIARWRSMRLESLGEKELNELLFKGPDGICIAAAPFNYIEGHWITHEESDRILRALICHFDVLIIDGGPGISDAVDMALHHATHILGVTSLEGQSLTQLAKIVNALDCPDDFTFNMAEGADSEKLRNVMKERLLKFLIVVNHTAPITKYSLQRNEIELTLRKPVFAEIPYSEHVLGALHGKGDLQALELGSKSGFAKSIIELAEKICRPINKQSVQGETVSNNTGGKQLGLFGRKRA